jgi:hypothetical protein
MLADELIEFALDDSERRLLRWGLADWGGPARCTEEMAVAMGFRSIDDLFMEGDRLSATLERAEAMTRFDWCRVLLATEIVFASNLVGSGWDWSITSGVSDAESLVTLRRIQLKLTREVRGLIGNGLGTRPGRK